MRTVTRRRVLQLTAGLSALGAGSAVPEGRHFRWTGSALGAAASLDLRHTDRTRAARLIDLTVAEVDRLEAIFSLQRSDSDLSRLNRDGRLNRPPLELVTVLETAALVSRLSGGAFDVTVQPLWRLHADAAARRAVVDRGAIERVRARVDWRRLDFDRRSIAFRQVEMSATLNGIAQGFITDRITELLRDGGMDEVLVNLGELRAHTARPPGHHWHVATVAGTLLLTDQALAVSSTRQTASCLSSGGPNLISPASGRPMLDGRCIVATARSAMLADAASTAIAASVPTDAGPLMARLAPLAVTVLEPTLSDYGSRRH